jgi:3-isopropylmalate dehydrogenase
LSMILASKMMLDWLGEKYNDAKCLNAANAIEHAIVTTLRSGETVPDLGGKTTTIGMAEAIAAALKKKAG